MSLANSHVIKNVQNFTVTTAANVNINCYTVRSFSVNDATGELSAGSDNDAAYRKFNKAAQCSGSITFEDPIESEKLRLLNNTTVKCQGVDINSQANVNVLVTGVRFGQSGFTETYDDETMFTMNLSGGAITIVNAP